MIFIKPKFIFITIVLMALTCLRTTYASQVLDGIVLTEVAPRILSKDGNEQNEKIFFKFDTDITGIPITGMVYSITGSHIGDLVADSIDTRNLTWNGKDTGGQSVPTGIYIYSIKLGLNRATGTIVVAR